MYYFSETLRLFPPLARVDRVCTKAYTIPGSSIQLQPGNVVAIPLYGIHMDPEYYPEPKEFKPERFMNEDKKDRASHLYLAFGVGPRNCIGKHKISKPSYIAASLENNHRFNVTQPVKIDIILDARYLL